MSFRAYARRVRDREVSSVRRHRALRDTAGCYRPLGFEGMWASLRTAGDVKNDKGEPAELDMWLAGCVSTCLADKGELDTWRRGILVERLPELRGHVARLGYPLTYPAGFDNFRCLLKMTESIVLDTDS